MRESKFPIHPLFLDRWSPRAMSGEEIEETLLMSLFEAARWAPSSYNAQPWRFIFARKNTSQFQTMFNALVEFNQSWCKNAAVLCVMISRTKFEKNEKPSRTHSFDCGAAWENLALQGSLKGLVVHGMQGFDYEIIRKKLSIPDLYQIEAMCAIGKPGDPEDLPEEAKKKEFPSTRKPIEEIIMEGSFRE